MSYFTAVKKPEDEKLKTLYNELIQHGWVGAKEDLPMNMFTYLGDRPDLLEWYFNAAQKILAEGNLPATLKQMVGLSLASRSNSDYCSHAHYKALEMLGVSEDLIHKCLKSEKLEGLPPVERVVIEFAGKVSENSNAATPEDFKKLEDVGLSKQDIMELILFIGLANTMMLWTNVGLVPNDE